MIRACSLPEDGYPVYLYDKADMEQDEENDQLNEAADGDSEDDNTIRMEFD